MLREGTYLQERYEIIERIGSGGMSDVYKARDRKLNRLVAIKVLKSQYCSDYEFVKKFKMEAQAAAGLTHPNVVNVYDVVDEDDLHYIVMELVEGITLKAFIASKGKLGMLETIGISIQIALGISAAHAQHIIHRDIKPQNVIISSDGKAKVADFGIARAVASDTLGSQAMGSVHYISPEQARGENSDTRSDIYSLGITMYEMVTGKLPFEGDTSVAIALAHIENDMPLASSVNHDVSPAFDQVILKCCQKKPERRYQSIDDLIVDLRGLLSNPDTEVTIVKAPVQIPSVGDTVVLTEQEVAEINVRAKINNEQVKKKAVRERPVREKDEEEHSGKFEKVIAIGGIILAIIVVLAVVFFIMKFSGVIGNSANDISDSIDVIVGDKNLLSEKQTVVPDVVGLNVELGENKLKDYNLGIEVSAYEFDDKIEKDGIISQSPAKDELVDKYTTVSVVVSKGATGDITAEEAQQTEDLSGWVNYTQNDVRNYLLEKGYNVETVEEFSSEYAPGVVIGINPLSAQPGNTITLTVSKGQETDLTQMPSIVGLTEDDAIGALADANLQPGDVTQVADELVPAGSVVSQAIPAGTNISKGTRIAYTVSLGPDVEEKYIASLRTSYTPGDAIGPGSSGVHMNVAVRLHQLVEDENGDLVDVYTYLMEPRTVSASTIIPIRFDYIEGAYGVEDGEVEVVDVDNDTVLKSYDVEFFKQQ